MNGSQVVGFWALLDRPGHLITPDAGTHEFTRLYYEPTNKQDQTSPPSFNLGYGTDRIGGQKVVSAVYDYVDGLTVTLTEYVLHVPAASVKCCWRR